MSTIDVTKENFTDVIQNSDIVFLDFWASWCTPCKSFSPVFEATSNLHPEIVFGTINAEAEQELVELFGIRSIPTVAVFRDQIGIFAQPGALPGPILESLVQQVKDLDMEKVREEIESESVLGQ